MVEFTSQAGVAYQIAVGSKTGATGLTLLNLGVTPGNDAFATPATLSGESASVTAVNLNASLEVGEPQLGGELGGLSLWYRWTAPRTGRYQIGVVSDDFDPSVGIFTGTAVNALTKIAEHAGSSASGALANLDAIAGTTYAIAVDASSAGTPGRFTLTILDSIWQASTGNNITGAPTVAPDGTVYVGSTDNALYAFGADGTRKWTMSTGGLVDTCSPAVADDGTVYVGSNSGKFFAVLPNGVVRWTHDFGATNPVGNSPALGADGTIYVKAGDGYLYALAPQDGSTQWRFNVNGPQTYASPAVAPDGTIYQGSDNGKLYALNPDGTLKWTFEHAESSDIYTVPAIDAAGNLYFSVLNTGNLFSVRSDGTLRWVYLGADLGSSSAAALSASGDTAYYAGYDGVLHAVDTTTGEARWKYTLGDEVRASSPAVDADGVIYVGCYDYKLYAVNFDGTLKRTYETGDWIRSSPAIHGTKLFFGSNDHKLYAFELGVGSANGPWPQYRQNPRRLGRKLASSIFTTQPAGQTVTPGGGAVFTVNATAGAITWERDGLPLAGATESTLTLSDVQPAHAGLYTAVATTDAATDSKPAILGIHSTAKVIGAAAEVGPDILHANGNIYDQVLLQGRAATVNPDDGQIVRISFVDLSDDIVQVEFTGAGSLTVAMDNASAPATAVNYLQPEVAYVKGHANIVITGADETSHVTIFTVGSITAHNQSLFRTDVDYDGVADIGYLAIASANGEFGGVRAGNVGFVNTRGVAGIYAPGVTFTSVLRIGDIAASADATPMLVTGSAPRLEILGGDLLQAENRAIQVSGIGEIVFGANTDSHGRPQPAQSNRARFETDGADVTSSVIKPPATPPN